MKNEQTAKQNRPSEPMTPFGVDPARPRWIAVMWLVLFAAWFLFLIVLAVRDHI